MSLQFIKLGNRYVNADEVLAVTVAPDGTVTITFQKGSPVVVEGDEADCLHAWTDSLVFKGQTRGHKAHASLAGTPGVGGSSTGEPVPPPGKDEGYESWTVEELHAEAGKRDLPGRSGMDKAALVKALEKSDRAAQKK